MTVKLETKPVLHGDTSVEQQTLDNIAFEQVLHKTTVLPLEGDQRGTEIHCSQGILWVTQENDGQDYILNSGESFVVTRKGRVVIEAMTDAILNIKPARLLPIDAVKENALIGKN